MPTYKKYYKIGEFSKLVNLSPSKLRFYDKIGLLSPEAAQENNYRYYNPSHLETVAAIKSLQRHGAKLSQIKQLLTERDNYFGNMANFATRRIKEIDEEIAKLKKFREEFKYLTDTYPDYSQRLSKPSFVFEEMDSFGILEASQVFDSGNADEQLEYYSLCDSLCKSDESILWFTTSFGQKLQISQDWQVSPIGQLCIMIPYLHVLPHAPHLNIRLTEPASYMTYLAPMSFEEMMVKIEEMFAILRNKNMSNCGHLYIFTHVEDWRNQQPVIQILIPLSDGEPA